MEGEGRRKEGERGEERGEGGKGGKGGITEGHTKNTSYFWGQFLRNFF
jgi:hypothetical protein